MKTTENLDNYCWVDDIFLTPEELTAVAERFGAPLFLYDEKGLRQRAKSLFSLFPEAGERHYFPVRKCYEPEILKIIAQTGMGMQCQTPKELELALACGCPGEKILYCAVALEDSVRSRLIEIGATLQVASPLVFGKPLPKRVFLLCWVPRGHNSNNLHECIGFSQEELPAAVDELRRAGVEAIGLTMRYDGNVSDEIFLSKQLAAAICIAKELQEKARPVEELHLDGGLGVKYNKIKRIPMEPQLAADAVTAVMGDCQMPVSMTLGMFLLEPCAIFMARVLGVQQSNFPVVLIDAPTSLIRFSTIDRYHHLSIVGKSNVQDRCTCYVAGNLPRFDDWLGKRRILPYAEAGDLLLVHDVGCSVRPGMDARCVLVREDGSILPL